MTRLLYIIIGLFAASILGGLIVISGCATTTTFHTDPSEVEIFINGKRCNAAPCIYHSRYGFPDRIRVQIFADGYKPAEFFIDTEAPLPSYLLWGVGSYVFHAFSSEYYFALYPDDLSEIQLMEKNRLERFNVQLIADPTKVANLIEQCLYWKSLTSNDEWKLRFFHTAKKNDCSLARTTLNNFLKSKRDLTPTLARALIRYMHKEEKLILPWETSTLCSKASIAYAKRIGMNNTKIKMPAFKKLCPKEHKLLLAP